MASAISLPDWKKLLRTARQTPDAALLDRRHVYILPTRYGVIVGVALLGMLVGSINYSLSLGFALTFLLAGLGVVAMLHTWRNLAHLSVAAGKTAPVFAGEEARFIILLEDHSGCERLAVGAPSGKQAPTYADVPAGERSSLELVRSSKTRGKFALGGFTVFTEFPLGLYHTWSQVEVTAYCLVYPRPAPPGLPRPSPTGAERSGGRRTAAGDEDFSGLRGYQEGDSPRRVD